MPLVTRFSLAAEAPSLATSVKTSQREETFLIKKGNI